MRSTLVRLTGVASVAALALVTVPATAAAQSNARDLMFAIDTTGSMSPYIAETKVAVDDLATDLASDAAGTRVGLVEYRDDVDAFQSRTVTDLTSDLPAFRAGLDGLSANGGGDTPESVYSGIARALCQDWNASSVKAVIVIGDAPAKDPEPVTGLTAQQVIDLATGASGDNPYCPAGLLTAQTTTASVPAGGVRVFAVSAERALTDQLQGIADATGGATTSVENIEDLADAIKDTVGDIDDIDEGGGLLGSIADLFGSSGS